MRRLNLVAALLSLCPVLALGQQPFIEYLPFEGHDGASALPYDYDVPAELVIGRLMYPDRGRGRSWLGGGTSWAVDYPKGDRTLAAQLRKFTRIDVRSVEQAVNLDHPDDAFYWPFLVTGLAGNWQLTDFQVRQLREYLLRGGFLYADSFFGSSDWIGFSEGLRRVFPDRAIIDLPADHPVFHIVHDIPELTVTQIPHFNSLLAGRGGWLSDGDTPHWRGIEDDAGRLMVLIGFNNDTPDSWQWADDRRYPAELATLGMQIGTNIAAYVLTH